MSAKKKKEPILGRGLGALLPTATPGGIDLMDIDRIKPAKNQPRTRFAEEALDELTDSIRTHGLLQPLVVRPGEGGEFILIAGERR